MAHMSSDYRPIELRDAPIVFLNMCESAQLWSGLRNSFVGFFLDRGARAIIGAEAISTGSPARSQAQFGRGRTQRARENTPRALHVGANPRAAYRHTI